MSKVNFVNKQNQQVKQSGFTLVELLITVAIVGILAGVAYPSYTDFVTRSNRSEGQRELLRLANIEEQRFIEHRRYTNDMTELGMTADPYVTDSGNYSIDAVLANDNQTFVLTATAKQSQVNDTGCETLTINEVGQKGPEACWEK